MKIRILGAGVASATLALALALAGCSSSGGGEGGSAASGSIKGQAITYWATNQAASVSADQKILMPEIKKFEQQTGVTVSLQVVPWANITPNTLSAAVSGKGPDVVNIGNTNATTFQATGGFYPFDGAALKQVGGTSKFVTSAFATAGAAGKTPTSLPLYGQVYGLFYNKKLFAAAHLTPPATWEDLVADAKQLTVPGKNQWGLVIPAGTVNVSMHLAFITTSQNGGSPFTGSGAPDFTSAAMVNGVTRYIDLMSKDHVVNTSDVQDTDGTQALAKFAKGNIGMYFGQTGATAGLAQDGMTSSQFGVVPIPPPAGGTGVDSFVAGTNISIFKSSQHLAADLAFVKFMTSAAEQEILNKAYGTLPVVKGVQAAAYANNPEQLKTWTEILADHATPLPLVSTVEAFQTNVGGAVVALFAKAATGGSVTAAEVKSALSTAQQKMAS
jgi:multiple sugar transport system substrate-binding protein